jgi:signal transduction histidine kinase
VDARRLRALLDVNRTLMAELDADAVLRRLLDVARDLTSAAYAAIGVLSQDGTGLERFVTAGVDDATRAAIGDLPQGRGVLGLLIESPRPLRLDDVCQHPQSYGFPARHPPMRTFLGVPITVRGEAWGNLYLTERAGGEPFTDDDEEVAVALADAAAIALANARLYAAEKERRRALQRANRVLETTRELSRALGGVTDVEQTLELVVTRSRALIGARSAELAVVDGDDFVVRAAAGPGAPDLLGRRIPVQDSLAHGAMRTGRSERFDRVPEQTVAGRDLRARRAITTPLLFRGQGLGVLVVLDRIEGDEPFTEDDVRVLEAFASSAAIALATAQNAAAEALRRSIEASEDERRRWARELHDETLQELAGLRLLLGGARQSNDPAGLAAAVDEATELIGMGVANLRALITDLRPASLDELGLRAALEALVRRVRTTSGLDVSLEVDLAFERGEVPTRLNAEIETTVYRLVQEALTNATKHADATQVHVTVVERGHVVDARVVDDGRGFSAGAQTSGFGLIGMRERLAVVRGSVRVDSAPGEGTIVHARIPSVSRAAGPEAAAQLSN